ncbi:MAG TPA: ATP-binding protein [Acidimicrobiales bacterium]|nr:ATP-binding protein [Acidimicrobiales bacterium]
MTLLVPLGSLVLLTTIEIASTSRRRDAVLDQTSLARASIGPSGLVTTLQNELNWASIDLTGFQEQVQIPVSGYEDTRRQTDVALDAFRRHIAGTSASTQATFEPALRGLDSLPDLRDEIDTDTRPHDITNIDYSQQVIDSYNALIIPLLDAAQDVGAEVDDEQLRVGLILSDGVTRQITTVQLIIGRMVKDVLFSPGGIDRRDEILVLIDLRTDLIEQAATMSSASGAYADLPGIDESAELTHRIDDQVLFAIGANQVDINLMVDALSNPDQQPYYAYQDGAQDLINDRADELEAGSLRRQRIMTALAGLTLAVAIAVVVAISRSITRPLISLTQQARSLATQRLPGAVHEVLATPSGSDVHMPELVPVEVRSTDEVAEVAEALNTLQGSALELAVEQAVLRRNIADSLVNLGRRNQNLLARQLDFITQLEANETDPQVLESLFRLDNLATRMRRNAEGLMVLAELDSPRHWPAPVPLLAVIRSALGEVEDFPRVVVHSVGPLSVMGGAAADLAHLLAELVENALIYSPPQRTVEIKGRYGPQREGYTLAIIDRGVGMPPAELDTANRRLNGHESFTVAPSNYLGHYVAGKLAHRHGMPIHLTATPGGGITATVQLPQSLLTDETDGDEAGGASPAAPGPGWPAAVDGGAVPAAFPAAFPGPPPR